jgi:hypothetical protein
MFAPWARFNARRVPTSAPLFWIEDGNGPEGVMASSTNDPSMTWDTLVCCEHWWSNKVVFFGI